MGGIGRTLALAAAFQAALASAQCVPAGLGTLPAGYVCSGTDIVDAAGNKYTISATQPYRLILVTSAATTVVGCPAANVLPAGYQCAFNTQGYVQELATGYLTQQSGSNLVYVTARPGASLPSGFSVKNDGTGHYTGPDGGTWEAVAPDYKLRPRTATTPSVTEDYDCPASRLPENYSCDEDAPGYIIGPEDVYYKRTSETGFEPLTVSGTTAPTLFTWTIPYSQLQGPRGFSWRVDAAGKLTKASGSVGVALECNGGLPLPAGYRCAGYGYGYVLDSNDQYFFVNAANTLERLAVSAAGEAPAGFTVLAGRTTMSDPAGRVYGFNDQRQLVLQAPADVVAATCPASRLPTGYTCAAARTDYFGPGDGTFGYVIHEEAGVWEYYVIVTDSAGNQRLQRLTSDNGAAPKGFAVVSTSEGTRLQGPDADTHGTLFKIGNNGVLEGESLTIDTSADDVTCDEIKADLPSGYSCGTTSGHNYVMGPGFNYYKITSRTRIDRLKVTNNLAPSGFTVNSDGTLTGPELNGYVYQVEASTGKLVAVNPTADEEVLALGGCPARELPDKFGCDEGAGKFSYVMGQILETCPGSPAPSTCEWEYFTVDRSTSPGRLRRLRVVNNQIPAGFTLLDDGTNRLRGPATGDAKDRVYSVDAATGILVSEEGPTEGPTINYYCNNALIPGDFMCANTQAKPASFCGHDGSSGCGDGNFQDALFDFLDEDDQHACVDQCNRFQNGITGGSFTKAGSAETITVPDAMGYMLDKETYNFYTLDGRYIVRVAAENNEIPDGFTLGADGRLVGPDAGATGLGWEYDVAADGTLVATGGSKPDPTVYTNVCPKERLSDDFVCVEDYESDMAFGFYIRDLRDEDDGTGTSTMRPRNNLFVVNADGQTMSQLTVPTAVDIAPKGFTFTDETSLTGPLGWKYKIETNRKVSFDHDATQPADEVDSACATSVDITAEDSTSTSKFIHCNKDSAGAATGTKKPWIQLGVGTTYSPSNPPTPAGWPAVKNQDGDWVDKNGNIYYWVFEANFAYILYA